VLTPFTEAMLKSIENQIERCSASGRILDVYKAAETVRSENIFDNVALEDIVSHIVRNVEGRCSIQFLTDSDSEISRSNRKISPVELQPLSNGKIG
jgi:hypothetical protein